MSPSAAPIHAKISGPIVMIGFGSIGKGTLPLIERHFGYDKSRFVVIDPEDKDRKILDERGIRFIHQAVTRDNYRHLLAPLLTDESFSVLRAGETAVVGGEVVVGRSKGGEQDSGEHNEVRQALA